MAAVGHAVLMADLGHAVLMADLGHAVLKPRSACMTVMLV
jgi:hypothetical protein